MKEIISDIWKRFQEGKLTLNEAYALMAQTLIKDSEVEMWSIIVNREDEEDKLEVVINEDEVIFTTSLNEKQADDLISYGAEEI